MGIFDNFSEGSLQAQFPGAYAAGQMQGALQLKADKRADNADARAGEELGMKKEAFGWAREDREKEKIEQAGMVQAANDGGYEGVISYLEKANPTKAIEFTKAKLSLDKDIMENDVMKATSKFKINEAMVESYGLLGKMGTALLQAPPEARQAIYQHMLPMVKQINPNAPDDVASAAPMFLLAQAQATPANQLFAGNKQADLAQSELGKLDMDIRARASKGLTAENDQGMAALMAKREQALNSSTQAQLNVAKAQLSMSKDSLQATEAINKNLQSASKDFTSFMTSWTSINSSFDELNKNPHNSVAQSMLQRKVAREFSGSGSMSEIDVSASLSSAGYDAVAKKWQSLISGRIEYLDPKEQQLVKDILFRYKDQKLEQQKQIESQFDDSMVNYNSANPNGDIINPKAIRKPSEAFLQAQQNINDRKTAQQGQIPPALQAAAKRALASGKWTEEQVQAIVQKQMEAINQTKGM